MIFLIRSGGIAFYRKSKKIPLWKVHSLLDQKRKPNTNGELFHLDTKKFVLSELVNTKLEDAYHELELSDYPLSLSMFDLLKAAYREDVVS